MCDKISFTKRRVFLEFKPSLNQRMLAFWSISVSRHTSSSITLFKPHSLSTLSNHLLSLIILAFRSFYRSFESLKMAYSLVFTIFFRGTISLINSLSSLSIHRPIYHSCLSTRNPKEWSRGVCKQHQWFDEWNSISRTLASYLDF